jgi:hypothetical protein
MKKKIVCPVKPVERCVMLRKHRRSHKAEMKNKDRNYQVNELPLSKLKAWMDEEKKKKKERKKIGILCALSVS